jgi:hypothetical protein
MITILKTRSCGNSCEMLGVINTVTPIKSLENTLLFHEVTNALFGGRNLTMNIGKSASIKLFENKRREFTEPLHGLVFAEREADVINLPTAINAPWIGNKKDARDR